MITNRMPDKATWGGRATLAGLVLAATSGVASAQTVDPGRAFRGLFVPAASGGAAALSADVYQGSNSGTGGSGRSELYDKGMFTGLTTNLSATWTGRRTTYGASGFSMLRYYADSSDMRSLFQGGAFGIRHQAGRKAFEFQQTVGQQPAYEFGGVRGLSQRPLGSLGEGNPEYGVDGYTMFSTSSRVGLGMQVGRYQWLTTSYQYGYSRVTRDENRIDELPIPDEPIVHSQEISARLSRQLWRNTGVHFNFVSMQGGRNRSRGREAGAWIHNFNIGIDKLQNLSLTRTVTLSLGGGGSVLNDAYGRRFVAVGAGGIEKRFGRTTRAGFVARRDIQFVEGLIDPVLTNGVSASTDGEIGRRWVFRIRAHASQGKAALIGNSVEGVPYTSYGADARLNVKLTGPFSLYGEYVRYHQQFEDPTGLFVLGRPVNRTGVRVGVVVGIPLYGQRGVE
jgi:hypothetical protein